MLDYEKLRDAQRTPHDWVRSIKHKYSITRETMEEIQSAVNSNFPERIFDILDPYNMDAETKKRFFDSVLEIL